jgi:23S rRNA (uracil1939-C5)-methyltransferase
MTRMQTQETPTTARPPLVLGRALVRVARLDERGEAVGRVERWLALPTDYQWLLVYGPRASETTPPDTCAFVGGLPGELVEVEVRWPTPRPGRKRARHTPPPVARLVHVIEASADRVAARCPVFGECGGCQLQHLAYERQLMWKTERVATMLREAGMGDAGVERAIACDDPWHYRNHMRFSVDRAGQVGLTARNSHRVIPLHACPIAHPLIDTALGLLAAAAAARPQVLVRCGAATGHLLIQPAPTADLRARLEAAGLELHTDDLTEELLVPPPHTAGSAPANATVPFRIRPSSFFQTNTAQANQMARLVLAGLPVGSDVTLVDAYCGVGTFAALLAPQAGRVLAIEESASAIRDARWNLRNCPNVAIIQAKTEAVLPATTERLDGLVIDPPRAGCGRPVLDALAARRVPHVVYVSCDPATLARDLAYLCRVTGVYRVVRVQPLDMFPHTAHIETVVTLEAS